MKAFKGIPTWRVIFDITASALWSLCNAIFSHMLATIIAEMADGSNVVYIAVVFLCFILGWEFLEVIADLFNIVTGGVMESNLYLLYFKELYKIKPDVLKRNNTGYISGVLNKVVARQETAYKQIVLNVPISTVYIAYYAFVMGKIHWVLGATLLGFVVVSSVFRFFVNNYAETFAEVLTKEEGDRNKSVIDFVSNINTVQKMKSLDFMCNKIKDDNAKCIKSLKKYTIFDELAYCGCKLLVFMFIPFVLIIADKLPIEDIEYFHNILVVVGIQLVHNSKALVRAIAHYNKFIGSLEKLEEIIVSENQRKELYVGDFLTARIIDLKYSYIFDRDRYNEKVVTIDIPFFSVNRGDKVCIQGESGQGKTTLLHLLSGEIENDCTTINYTQNDKILDCVFIAQDTEMFDMSLRDNLTLGKNISDLTLYSYIQRVGLGDWFDKQVDGLDTMLGERGVFVSTGQRQRLNLIRGLLIQDKDIYLLDEPTSNVDEATEKSMVELISEVLKDKTVVIVTHRPAIKDICNKVYEFKDGTVSLLEE